MKATDRSPSAAERDVTALVERWQLQSAEYLADWQDWDSHDGFERRGQGIALADAASELRAALAAASAGSDDAHTETVTEYRVTGFNADGRWLERETRSFADADYVSLVMKRDGWTQVQVESRTVSTSRRESEWKATDQ